MHKALLTFMGISSPRAPLSPLIQLLLADEHGEEANTDPEQCLPEMDDTAMERMSSLNRAWIPGLQY